MRTTLTIDADVSAQLQQLRARKDRPFKQLVNEVLRAGLTVLDRDNGAVQHGPYTRVVSLGRPRLPAVDDVSEAMAIAEGDDYR